LKEEAQHDFNLVVLLRYLPGPNPIFERDQLRMKTEEQGSYKWLIMAAVFLSQSLTFGLTYSVGVLYKDWLRYFDSTASFLSLVGSAPTAMSGLIGR